MGACLLFNVVLNPQSKSIPLIETMTTSKVSWGFFKNESLLITTTYSNEKATIVYQYITVYSSTVRLFVNVKSSNRIVLPSKFVTLSRKLSRAVPSSAVRNRSIFLLLTELLELNSIILLIVSKIQLTINPLRMYNQRLSPLKLGCFSNMHVSDRSDL